MKTIRPKYTKKKNRSEILRNIYFHSDISRLEVSDQLGISPATVTNIVAELIEKNPCRNWY